MNALHGSVLSSLGVAIVSGEHPEGSVLNLEGLCQTYGVSRSVAREAVRVLESMGLLASRRRVGITVQPRAQWNVFDPRVIRWRLDGTDRVAQLLSLSELRVGIEPAAASLAAVRATPEQCRQLAAAVSDMEVHGRAGDLEAYLAADQAFHRVLLAASGNEMIASLGDVVSEVLGGRTHHGLMPHHPNPAAIALHEEVARAVRAQDAAAAERAMRKIIDEAAAALSEQLAPQGETPGS
ncbi:FadR/GntR family transcriptional regulator [Nocardioides sp. Kera G14]|uniref:FadR/GntR family transcriptional regulator n=1 Tax=Nocardioides sp. Kera G14 TaxID=2884264 RepID=UPI001D109136|nr:FCD domain-containing protein [Nocardioides sp. Kera G14]UDY24719.1 FCD domain-containing protein [Nocardioides sp. Kera G14]